MNQSLYDEAFRRITTRLADDTQFMTAIRLDLAIAHQPWDHLAQHPGELCDCGHPIGDHALHDQTVTHCYGCDCPGFSDSLHTEPW